MTNNDTLCLFINAAMHNGAFCTDMIEAIASSMQVQPSVVESLLSDVYYSLETLELKGKALSQTVTS